MRMDHNKRVFLCTLVFIVLIYSSIVNPTDTNISQDNGMNFIGGKEVRNKSGGVENKNGNKTGGVENENAFPFKKREQQILKNVSKSLNIDADQIEETVLTWLPSVLGVVVTVIIFSILILISLKKKHYNETFHTVVYRCEDANLPLQH